MKIYNLINWDTEEIEATGTLKEIFNLEISKDENNYLQEI